MPETKKRCIECGGEYPLLFFTKKQSVLYAYNIRRPRCKRCEQERRDLEKRVNRFRVKAANAIRSHEAKFVSRGICLKGELRTKFGWSIDRLFHDFEHTHKNGCPYCHKLFSEMQNGLASLTVDIIDTNNRPFYESNVLIVCSTCNKEKQRSSPDDWGENLHCHRLWEEQKQMNDSDFYKGTLLEGIDSMA